MAAIAQIAAPAIAGLLVHTRRAGFAPCFARVVRGRGFIRIDRFAGMHPPPLKWPTPNERDILQSKWGAWPVSQIERRWLTAVASSDCDGSCRFHGRDASQ